MTDIRDDSVAVSTGAEDQTEATGSGINWGRWIRAVISVALIALVLSRANVADILAAFRKANLGGLAVAGSLTFVGAVITASRWRLLLNAQSVRTSLFHLIKCWMVACFFNQFLPSTVGGDARRIYDSWKLGASKAGAAATIGVDRIIGLLALMLYGVIALYLSSVVFSDFPGLNLLVVGTAAALAALAVFIFVPNTPLDSLVAGTIDKLPSFLARVARKFQTAFGVYRGRGWVLGEALLLSVVLQLNVIFFYFLVGESLQLGLGFLDYMLIVPIASVVMLLPITINGIGLREGTFAVLLAGYGIPASTAVAFAWASFALFLIFGLLGGVVYALQRSPQVSKSSV